MYHHRLAPMLIWNSTMPQPSHCSPPAIIFSQQCISGKSCVCVLLIQSCLTANQWTVAHQAPLSMLFSRQEYWSGLPFLSPRDLPDPGIKIGCPALQADSLLFVLPFELPRNYFQ